MAEAYRALAAAAHLHVLLHQGLQLLADFRQLSLQMLPGLLQRGAALGLGAKLQAEGVSLRGGVGKDDPPSGACCDLCECE